MKYTHKTKKGFGSLLAAGIECYIHSKVKGGIFICLKGRGNLSGQPPVFWGKMKDLEPINP